MLKNFIVVTSRLKEKGDGFAKYSNYLLSQNAKSHKETKIVPISKHGDNIKDFIISNLTNCMEFDFLNTKGGRKIESYGQSFVFSLPNGTPEPSKEQWNEIRRTLLLAMFKGHSIEDKNDKINKTGKKKRIALSDADIKKLCGDCLVVAHNQKNPHLNIIIPRIFKKNDGELVRLDQIEKIGFLYSAKKAFNTAVLKHLALDFKKYEPENVKTGKSLKAWQKIQKDAAAAVEAASLASAEASRIQAETKKMEEKIAKESEDLKEREIQVRNSEIRFRRFKEVVNSLLNNLFHYANITPDMSFLRNDYHEKIYNDYEKISNNEEFFNEDYKTQIEKTASLIDAGIKEEEYKITPLIKQKFQ